MQASRSFEQNLKRRRILDVKFAGSSPGTMLSKVPVSDGLLAVTQFFPPRRAPEDATRKPPLLMINGWTCPKYMWGTLLSEESPPRPRFSIDREIIVFDNRGVGESTSCGKKKYTVEQLADDAASILDYLGHSRAHILGYSLGGMVAQQLAANYPDRVSSLVLCSTTGGGKMMTPADKDFAKTFFGAFRSWKDEDPETHRRAARVFVKGCLGSSNEHTLNDTDLDRLVSSMLNAGTRTFAGMSSQLAALSWGGGLDLSQMRQPALIVHGDEDRVLPLANARSLAERLPTSRMCILRGHGHGWLMTDESSGSAIGRFLSDVDGAGELCAL